MPCALATRAATGVIVDAAATSCAACHCGGLLARLPDARQYVALTRHLACTKHDFEQHPIRGRGNFTGDLIRFNFEQRVSSLHRVAGLLQPLENGAGFAAAAQIRHSDCFRHAALP